ncbi:MAG: hypothetical protein LBL98_07335 [Ruminococcus sp.]|jgi:hypothetical protein|nr:hypothetical protein [Ruminococcus sp.]
MAKTKVLEEIQNAKTAREIVAICLARGADVSFEEAERYIEYRKSGLSDNDLDAVTGGGGRINSPLFYICGRFKEGKSYIWNCCANCLHFRGAPDIGGTCNAQ